MLRISTLVLSYLARSALLSTLFCINRLERLEIVVGLQRSMLIHVSES